VILVCDSIRVAFESSVQTQFAPRTPALLIPSTSLRSLSSLRSQRGRAIIDLPHFYKLAVKCLRHRQVSLATQRSGQRRLAVNQLTKLVP
jgi:hypothetical protein